MKRFTGGNDSIEHEPDRSDVDHRFRSLYAVLVILAEPPVSTEPRERMLYIQVKPITLKARCFRLTICSCQSSSRISVDGRACGSRARHRNSERPGAVTRETAGKTGIAGGSRCRLYCRFCFCLHPRIPAPECLAQLVVEHLRTDLQQLVSTALTPVHLLLLDHSFAHQLIHR